MFNQMEMDYLVKLLKKELVYVTSERDIGRLYGDERYWGEQVVKQGTIQDILDKLRTLDKLR